MNEGVAIPLGEWCFEDVLVGRVQRAFVADRITAEQLDEVIGAILGGQIGTFAALEALLVRCEGAREAQPMPEGVDEFDLAAGWWWRPDGSLVEIQRSYGG